MKYCFLYLLILFCGGSLAGDLIKSERNLEINANTVTAHGENHLLKIEENPNIIFYSKKNTELIRIDKDGNFFVKGKLIKKDIELYLAMREFLILK